MKLPETYKQNMKSLLNEEYDEFIESFEQDRYYGLRVNTTKISVEDFLKISPFHLEPIPWTSNGFYYQESERPAKHPYYYAGLYYLQEPSAMMPAQTLEIEEGDIVLDACAAPGGKSTELLNKLNGTGLLFSNDISSSRAQGLLHNIEKWGCGNVIVASEDISTLAKYYPETFDKVLIDAPCSGEGMFRKNPSLIQSWEERGNEYYVKLQKEIVKSALSLLKPGGKMVYSTCTFSCSENEDIIAYMKEICPEIQLIHIESPYFSRGVNGYEQCVRLYPHKIKGEGHFVAYIQKGDKPISHSSIIHPNEIPNEDAKEFFKNIQKSFDNGTFQLKKDKLYFIPDINLKGIRILRSGLFLGECKKNRFEPSQALAMNLKKEEFKNVIDLDISDPNVIKYLKGETIQVSNTKLKGWVLVCVNGYSLGFGKIQNGTIKNKYAQGWRWQ